MVAGSSTAPCCAPAGSGRHSAFLSDSCAGQLFRRLRRHGGIPGRCPEDQRPGGELEIQDSLEALDAYFERQKMNREFRKYELDPQEAEKLHQQRLRNVVMELYQKVDEGGPPTKTLNWLLQELAAPTLAYRYLPSDQTLADSKLDQKLSPDDLRLICLTDGAGHVRTLVATAGSGEVLKTQWPFALKASEFDEVRRQFEESRDKVISKARDQGGISFQSAKNLRDNVIGLQVALEEAYPPKRRTENADVFLEYGTAKRFLLDLWGSVYRATSTTDMSVFKGRLRFQGDSVVALLQHMYSSGLQFAPPEPGGEGVYRRLFNAMRNLYINLGEEKANAAVAKKFSRSPSVATIHLRVQEDGHRNRDSLGCQARRATRPGRRRVSGGNRSGLRRVL